MASKTSQRSWQLDWAGPHGTAWGTCNACLTTITAGWLGHLVHVYWPLPTGQVNLMVAGGMVLGAIWTLGRAAFGSKAMDPITIVYKMLCLGGVGGWLLYMESHPSWPARWLGVRVLTLIMLALLAGIAAGLASDRPEPVVQKPVALPQPSATATTDDLKRQHLAVEWRTRIDRLCGIDGTKVPAVELWERGNGYSVQAIVPPGADWQTVDKAIGDFASDLDLAIGGKITVVQGRTVRAAIIDVTTRDLLAEPTEYPADRAPHSIKDDLAVGLRDDGSSAGPNLHQKCMVLAGETGSGKTNAGKVLAAEIYTSVDCLLWEWELTGGGLWAAEMRDWLAGHYDVPPIDWCAFDGRELLWMTRAALRIGYARKPGYRNVMIDADDDKLPVSPQLPAIILMGDEIARVTGNASEHPEAAENLLLIAFELRAVAIRAIFLALRGTDDVISQGLQSACAVRGVMKITEKSEASWVLGPGHDFGPEDTPYEGCGGLIPGSGLPVYRLKYHRMLPSTIRPLARLGSTRRPSWDHLSLMAANGRYADGTPMDGLLDGELDCYDTRWDRFRTWLNAAGDAAAPPRPAVIFDTDGIDAAQRDVDAAMAAVDARIAEVADEVPADGELSDDERRVFDSITARMPDLAEAGFGDDWADEPDQPETPALPEHRQAMLDLIGAAGQRGIRPKDLLPQLAERGIVISRATLHTYLNESKAAGQVHQPSYGRWAIKP